MILDKFLSFFKGSYVPVISEDEKIKVAYILDDFSYECFKYECDLIKVLPDNWKSIIINENPQLLFVESYWQGNKGNWSIVNKENTEELIKLVKFCKEKNIPTVFWNKEDPYSFHVFLSVARHFDIIYTTDIDSINNYKEILNHDKVYLMTFAAQSAIHNPIEIYEKRKECISFAGSYYKNKFPQRQLDFENIADKLLKYGLDIYDRHYDENKEEFEYPTKYKNYIIGKLSNNEIVKAYKGYKFSFNVNSIIDSQTMFARRVVELIASNTMVISSNSKALENLFGDLVIFDNNEIDMNKVIDKLMSDNVYYCKYRLLGLRKILEDYTYKDRFAQIVKDALGIDMSNKYKSVAVIGFAQEEKHIKIIKEVFKKQKYKNKKLYIFIYNNIKDKKDRNIYNLNKLGNKRINEIVQEEYISYFHREDYYGENYLTDLMYATIYAPEYDSIGKSSYYTCDLKLKINEGEYRRVSNLSYRSSIIKKINIYKYKLKDIFKIFNNKIIKEKNMISIDCFNYINKGSKIDELSAKIVLDLDNINIGKTLNKIENIYFRNNSLNKYEVIYKLDLGKFITNNKDVLLLHDKEDNSLNIDSNIKKSHQYIYYNIEYCNFQLVPQYTPINVDYNKEYLITSFGETDENKNIYIVIITYSKNKKEMPYFILLNTSKILSFDKNIEKIMICLRIQNKGKSKIEEISIKEREKTTLEEGNSHYLVLSNNYPSNNDLYKNAFVHRRVKAYKEYGLDVDVMSFNHNNQCRFEEYEFDGVKVFRGYKEHLRNLLKNSKYKKILIHFINLEMYEIIKEFENDIDIIIWFHGAETRPWYRSYFLYEDTKDLTNIIKTSILRMEFIKKIILNDKNNIKFIFISETLRKMVEEDTGIKINKNKYEVIHNFIDNNLFNYIEKDETYRNKILSIRPFASRTYANDLSVKAILELSKRDYFNQLEFCFYGEGLLFNETMKPLREFDNIKIYNKFLSQNEISKLHKEYGVFLVPTRLDTQGVSRDEAMSSGLVPITNNVGAIEEFVDNSCAMLVKAEDYLGIVNAIEYLYLNPREFINKSKLASKHVREISSKEKTILREVNLIKALQKHETKHSGEEQNNEISYNNQPKLSILIAAYNVEKYIEENINSIINQTMDFNNIEVIIVDDKSTDNTPKILDDYSKKYPEIKVIHNTTRYRYPGKVRNKALDLSKGKYVMFLDSDDLLDKNACNTLYNLMEIYESDYVIGKYSYYYEENNKIQPALQFENNKYKKSTINFNLSSLDKTLNLKTEDLIMEDMLKLPGTSCNKIFKREFLLSNNIKYKEDQVTGEDYILNHKCLLKAEKISYFPVNVFYYRRRADENNKSITQSFSIDIINDLMKQKSRTYDLYKNTPYNFDYATNLYFLNMIYNKIREIKDYPDDVLIEVFQIIKLNINIFNIKDERLSYLVKELFNNINEERYDQVLSSIRKTWNTIKE